jgi:hypothetical protein
MESLGAVLDWAYVPQWRPGAEPTPELEVCMYTREDLPPVELADLPQWHSSAALVDRHVRLYDPAELDGLLREAGFSGIAIDQTGAPRYHWRATV